MSKQLADIQNKYDQRGIDIQKVGVKNVEVPLIIQRKDNENQTVSAKASICVGLPKDFKGTHMSRFVEVLNDWRQKQLLGVDIKGCLEEICKRLNAKSAHLKFEFKYFIEKHAPISKLGSVMGYDCYFEGELYENKIYNFYLGSTIPITTLCPCSKEISRYSAHNQRAMVRVKIGYENDKHIWLEDLISRVEKLGSSQLYTLLKRSDEKYVTEFAYENPKFVEDVLRDVVLEIRKNEIIDSYEVEIEAYESIHNHSAYAYQKESKKKETNNAAFV